MMKKLLLLMPSVVLSFSVTSAQAGRIEPARVSCWFFREEKLELQQTCTYESYSWSGGGVSTLLWQDGVKTTMAWGLQGRGERPCEDTSLDKVCGSTHFRNPTTLKRISDAEVGRMQAKNQKIVRCVKARRNSVCYLR